MWTDYVGDIEMKNWWKTNSIEDTLGVIRWLEKGEQNVDVCHNVRFAHSSVCTICDNSDRSM